MKYLVLLFFATMSEVDVDGMAAETDPTNILLHFVAL